MEDKDVTIRLQAARIRELEAERDKWKARAEYAENENYKLYRRDFCQRVFNMIPD